MTMFILQTRLARTITARIAVCSEEAVRLGCESLGKGKFVSGLWTFA